MPKLIALQELGEARREEWIELLHQRFANATTGKPCELGAHPDYPPLQAFRSKDGKLFALCLEEAGSPLGETGARKLVAAASVSRRSYPLSFSIGPKDLARVKLKVAAVFGSKVLLAREDAGLAERVLLALDTEDIDAVLLEAMSLESFFGSTVSGSRRLRETFTFHWLGEPSLHRVARLPDTFDAYLQTWKSKRRNQYRKLLRDFEGACKNGMTVRAATTVDDVEWLYHAFHVVGQKSWKTRRFGEVATESHRSIFRAMAEKGWLLSYVLLDGENPIAVAFGCTVEGAWLFEDTVFDPAFIELSPGRVLIFRLIEDLIERGVRLLDFGTGDNQYKEVFANDVYTERKLLLCRRTPKMAALGTALDMTHELDHWLRQKVEDMDLSETLRAATRGNVSWRDTLSKIVERARAKRVGGQKQDSGGHKQD